MARLKHSFGDRRAERLRRAIETRGSQYLPESEIAINTGLHRSEQYRLTWDCVDFERQLLTVPQSKNGETRHVPLNSSALAAFLVLKRLSDGKGQVFSTSSPRRWFEPAVKAAGVLLFTWHSLRHTFASRLIMAGVDLRTGPGTHGAQNDFHDLSVCPSGAIPQARRG